MESPFPPFDPEGEDAPQKNRDGSTVRLRDIPMRVIIPNVVTLLSICAGLSSIRFGIEGRIDLAVAAILLAGVLDGLDGRIARLLRASSRFGAQMDSLADFVNFGVAPGLLVYFTVLQGEPFGWITALIFASCACLRLARFNVMLDDEQSAKWSKNFFLGVPAPAGALIVLLPVYIELHGYELTSWQSTLATVYVLVCAYLLVSNIPTFAGKQLGERIRRDLVLPIMIAAVIVVAIVVSYPWHGLTILAVAYLASLPFSFLARQKQIKAEAEEESS